MLCLIYLFMIGKFTWFNDRLFLFQVCYHCREPGHGVADCPKALADVEQGTGVCFRCGSTEHDVSQCTARIDPNEGTTL